MKAANMITETCDFADTALEDLLEMTDNDDGINRGKSVFIVPKLEAEEQARSAEKAAMEGIVLVRQELNPTDSQWESIDEYLLAVASYRYSEASEFALEEELIKKARSMGIPVDVVERSEQHWADVREAANERAEHTEREIDEMLEFHRELLRFSMPTSAKNKACEILLLAVSQHREYAEMCRRLGNTAKAEETAAVQQEIGSASHDLIGRSFANMADIYRRLREYLTE